VRDPAPVAAAIIPLPPPRPKIEDKTTAGRKL
jgi:hypothetical protein